MIVIHDVEQGSEAWHELRIKHPYTGSGSEKLLRFGATDYSANKEDDIFRGNFYTKRGHILEEEALELYEQITGNNVVRIGFVTNTKWPSAGYSPDGLDTVLDLPLEVKAFKESSHIKMFNGDIPVKVLSQVHFGQFVWEKKRSRLIIYNPDLDAKLAFKIIEVKYNRNIQNNFKSKFLIKERVNA